MRPSRASASVLEATILGVFLWQAWVVRYVVDDSFISFRYARNLIEGRGLVYNVGERVEGYTNFLWVVLLAGTKRVLPSVDLPALAIAAGVIAGVVAIVLTCRSSLLLLRPRAEGVVAGALLAVHAGFVAWTTAGLETALFAALVLAGALAGARHLQGRTGIGWVPVFFGLAAFTRADGAIFFVVTLAVVAIADRRRGHASAIRLPLRLAAVFAATYLPYLLWRWSYYGDLVPNTAYAKAGGGLVQVTRGLGYVWSYVIDYGVLVWMPALVLYLGRARDAWVWYFVSLIGVYLTYVVYIGGESLGFHRFMVHIAPLMCVVVAASLVDVYRRLAARASQGLRIAALSVATFVLAGVSAQSAWVPVWLPDRARWFEPQSELSFPGDSHDHSYRWFGNYFVDRLAVAARYLETHAPRGSLVASTPAGSIAYYMNHRVIDMLGLTDRHIARTAGIYQGEWQYGRAGHEKGDGPYVLSRAPDFILMGNVAVLPFPLDERSMATKLVFKSEHELWAEPEFHARYELVSVRLADSGPFQYFTFYRRKP